VSPELMFGGEIHFGYSNYKNRYQESKQQNYEAAEFLQKRLMSVD